MAMLRETQNVRRITGEPSRRWFAGEFLDLLFRLEAIGSLNGFQPRALTRIKRAGHVHNAVDAGGTAAGPHKASPVLVSGGSFYAGSIYGRLEQASDRVPEEFRKTVLEKVKGLPHAEKI